MARTYSRKQKLSTQARKDNLFKAREAYTLLTAAKKELNEVIKSHKLLQHASEEGTATAKYQLKAKNATTKYWSMRRQAKRMDEANAKLKLELKRIQKENCMLRRDADQAVKELRKKNESFEEVLGNLQTRITTLTEERRMLQIDKTRFKKRAVRVQKMRKKVKENARQAAVRGRIFKLTHQGVYTKRARELARYLASVGTAEKKVGQAIFTIGKLIGVEVDRIMSKRTVQRAVLESGVAAEIQLGYEMAKSEKLTYSSDSTSHKHIEYESRTIAIQVVDYTKPDAEPFWKQRTLGLDTSVNHTSQTQVDGLRRRLEEIATVFNDSPLAKREGLRFCPDDFVFRLVGTSGDHAADQKRSHEILREWKTEVIFQRLGEEALFNMSVTRVVAFLLPMKSKQLEEMGDYAEWEKLSDDEKQKADTKIVREVGRQVFDTLGEKDKERLTRFIRTGCCMHKDLNTVKGGDKAMQDSWKELGKTPPIILANKDNTAVLERCVDQSDPSPAEKRATEVSKRGGSHATMLGGLICRNKDKKKGQQDTYNWYMEVHAGQSVPYPDVSNTRYGSHGEAAAVLVVYHDHFIRFMEFVRDAKDKPGLTNIEKNFLNALKDIPTFTELCVLAMYNINISRPFMQHVRLNDNLLNLEPFFLKKRNLLSAVSQDPKRWTGTHASHEHGSLDCSEWDEWGLLVMKAVHSNIASLPDLDGAVSAFTRGALTTFAERFSEEFLKGGEIDKLSPEEKAELYFSSTNDVNEGALGSWRLGQRHRPNETILKFNASFVGQRNDTELFHQDKLNTEADEAYLRRKAREKDSQHLQRQMKDAQMRADAEKVAENHQKEAVRKEKQTKKADAITETGKRLVLDNDGIDKLNVDGLNRQLDWHRDNEKRLNGLKDRVPMKTHMKNKSDRIQELKKAVQRFKNIPGLQEIQASLSEQEEEVAEPGEDLFYNSDYEDNMV